jgi:hypothetical protein
MPIRTSHGRSGTALRGLFNAIDRGSPPLKFEQYNGGLFAHDDLLDRLKVPDEVCKGLDRLAAYEYRPPALDDEMAVGNCPPTRRTRHKGVYKMAQTRKRRIQPPRSARDYESLFRVARVPRQAGNKIEHVPIGPHWPRR